MKKETVAIIKLPRMKTKKVFIGCYFNHYNAIVLFKNRPTHYMPHRFEDEDVVDLLEESKADNILACGFLEDFKELFPTLDLSELIDKQTGNVISLEPIKIIKAKIKACWDDNGKLLSIQWNLDGYQY